jgi:menaquinone-9 beta-reductase
MATNYDVVVVGARCAGAAVAMLLARAGLRVLAVDRGVYGTDTLSTHALMRAGVRQLHRWGLLPALIEAGTPPVRVAVFRYVDETLRVPIRLRDGVDALYAPRRTLLDRVLVDGAIAAGVTVRYGSQVVDLARDGDGRVRGVQIKDHGGATTTIGADLVIGADGMHSTVARQVGARIVKAGRHASGLLYAYWQGVPLEGFHWYYAPGVSAGAVRTNDAAVCVFAATPSSRFRAAIARDVSAGYHQVLREVDPELAAAVAAGTQMEPLRGFAGQAGYIRQSIGPGWALVGDASYFKDPLTAHGITDALRDAEWLARAVLQGTDAALRQYELERNTLVDGLFEVTDAIASFDWDLPAVQQLHRSLSDEMARENRLFEREEEGMTIR